MPGYEPFLLCDFHVHTQWSDGRLTVREVVDLYGQTVGETGHFDVEVEALQVDFLGQADVGARVE